MAGPLKPADAEAFCRRPDAAMRIFLLSGDDDGMVADAAGTLSGALRLDGEALERQAIGEDALKASGEGLLEALQSQPLLGPRPILRLGLQNERFSAAILSALAKAGAAEGADHNPLLIETPKLKKASKLRETLLGFPRAVVMEFGRDSVEDISRRAQAALKENGVEIEREALALFAADLPGHRGLANQEIEKLALYGRGLGRAISVADMAKLMAVDTEVAVYAWTDAVFSGQTAKAQASLDRLLVAGTSPITLMRALHREAERMLDAHGKLASAGGAGGSAVGRQLSPPVFDWAWREFEAKLKRWPASHVVRLLSRLREAETGAKSAGHLSGALITELTTALASAASRAA